MRGYSFLFAALVAGVLFVACGGGAAEDGDTPGERVTDPALVPTSTPIQNPAVYKISGDTVQIIGGQPTTVPTNNTPAAGSNRYTVQPGETCAGIAADHGITVDELLAANRTIDSDCLNLSAGQELVIPGAPSSSGNNNGAATTTPTPSRGGNSSGGGSYTVQDGDTCGGIAASLGVSVDELIAANPSINADCSNLVPGDELNRP